MQKDPVRAGIFGWGNIGRSLHGPCLTVLDEFEIVAVCDPDPDQLLDAQAKIGCPTFQEAKDFLQHPGLELVVVATPNHLHGPLAIAALEAGKHVVVEKPMCLGLHEADRMIELARAKDLVLTVHQNRRWDEDFLAIQRLLEEGRLGKTVMFQTRVTTGPYVKRGGWGITKEYTGGGAFLSFGPHLIDQVLCLAPPGPVSVFGVVKSVINPDDYFTALLTFETGWTAQIEMSRGTRIRSLPRFLVMCERGDIRFWPGEDEERSLQCKFDDGTEERIPLPPAKPLPMQSQPFYRNLFGAIRHGQPVIVDPAQSRRYVAIAEAIARSSRDQECLVVS